MKTFLKELLTEELEALCCVVGSFVGYAMFGYMLSRSFRDR